MWFDIHSPSRSMGSQAKLSCGCTNDCFPLSGKKQLSLKKKCWSLQVSVLKYACCQREQSLVCWNPSVWTLSAFFRWNKLVGQWSIWCQIVSACNIFSRDNWVSWGKMIAITQASFCTDVSVNKQGWSHSVPYNFIASLQLSSLFMHQDSYQPVTPHIPSQQIQQWL